MLRTGGSSRSSARDSSICARIRWRSSCWVLLAACVPRAWRGSVMSQRRQCSSMSIAVTSQRPRGGPAMGGSPRAAGSPTPVELQPRPRFGDPRPIHPTSSRSERLLRVLDRPAGRAVGAAEAHRDELVVDHIGTDPPVRAVNELFDLRAERVDDRRTLQPRLRRQPGRAALDVVLDGVVVAAGQLGRAAVGAYEVVGRKNLHDLSGRLDDGPSWTAALQHRRRTGRDHSHPRTRTRARGQDRGALLSVSGDFSCPPVGSSAVRLRGDSHVRAQLTIEEREEIRPPVLG
jgi:hypothetical protein